MSDPRSELERKFADFYGVNYVLSTSSGSTAYLTALLSLQLPSGSRVLLSAYNWPQLAAVPKALGYRVELVDCDEHARMSPLRVSEALSRGINAIVVCHLFGNPSDVRKIARLASNAGVAVVEDCSQSLMASQHGRLVGTWGDIGFASLGPGKALSAGEGGLLWTNDPGLYRRAFAFSQHPDRASDPRLAAACLTASLSLRMHPAAAQVALEDLVTLRARIRRACARHEALRMLLRGVDGVHLVEVLDNASPAWQHLPLLVAPRIGRRLSSLWWDKRPAYLLHRSSRFQNARGFARNVRYIETGRGWEDVSMGHIMELAQVIHAAAYAP